MGQREDVTASLLASHGVDGAARRKVASEVKATVDAGLRSIATTHDEVATAASAVVLASDLRAPLARITGDGYASESDLATVDVPSMMASLGVSPNRQGWRARLANVERLLHEVDRGFAPGVSAPTWNRATAALIEAANEVRAMIDGEGE